MDTHPTQATDDLSPSQSHRRMCAWIFGTALALRITYSLVLPDEILWPDGFRYQVVAENLREGRGFGSVDDIGNSVPVPALFMAAVQRLFGDSLISLRIANSVLGSIVCCVGFLIGSRLFGRRCGLIVAAILVTYPYYIYISAVFEYPTTIFILLMGLVMLLLTPLRSPGKIHLYLVAGLLCGVAALTIPTVLAFVPLAVLAILNLSPSSRRRSMAMTLVFVCGICLPLAVWSARNYHAYHRFILTNCAGEFNFWKGNNPFFEKYRDADAVYTLQEGGRRIPGTSPQQIRLDWESMEVVKRTAGLSLADAGPYYAKAAIEFIKEDPARFGRLTVWKFFNLWRLFPDSVHLNATTGPETRLISIVSYTPLLVFAIGGIWATRARWRDLVLIYAYILSLAAAYSVIHTSVRYRLPIDFFLALFAAFAVHTLLDRPSVKRWIGERARRKSDGT